MGSDSIDYSEIFSSVVKSTAIRLVLSLVLSSNWVIHQLDFNFLHGDLLTGCI